MRLAVALLLLCFGAVWASPPSVPAPYRTTRINDQNYVSLKQWCDSRELDVFWTKKNDELRVRNDLSWLSLKVNSARIELDGITVFMSYPVLQRGETVYISETDVNLLFNPLLNPARGEKRVKTIALCAGHGGRDAGFKSGPHEEKHYTLQLAQEVQSLLEEAGYRVVMIRSGDQYVPLDERPALAKKLGADLYLSLHYNSAATSPNSAVRGVEVFCLPPANAQSTTGRTNDFGALAGNRFDEQNILLAYQIQKALVKNLPAADRGVRRARFAVLRSVEMPAVLIEAGFMSHPEEMKQISDAGHRRKTAQAIVEGVRNYCRLTEHDLEPRTAHRSL